MFSIKNQIFFFFFAFVATISSSQEVLESTIYKNDSIMAMLEDAWDNLETSSQNSFMVANSFLTVAEHNNNVSVIIQSNRILGKYYEALGEIAKAYYYTGLAYESINEKHKASRIGFFATKQYAELFKKAKDYDRALKFHKEAMLIYDNYTSESSHERFLNLGDIAILYSNKKDYENALKYYALALEEAKNLENKIWLSSAYNNIGYAHYQQGDFEKALKYYEEAKTHLKSTDESVEEELFYVNIEENIAHIYIAHYERYREASLIYKHVAKIRRKHNAIKAAINADIEQLHCLVRINDVERGNVLNESIEVYFEDKKDDPYYETFLQVRLLSHKYKGNYKQHLEVSEEYIKYLNKKSEDNVIANQEAIANYIKFQENDFKKKLNLEKELAKEKEASMSKDNRLLFLISLLLCMALVTLLLIIKGKKEKEKRVEQENLITKLTLENTTLEKEKLNDMLESKHQDIVNMVTDSTMRTKFLKKLLHKIEVEKVSVIDDNTTLKELIFDIKSQIQIEERLTGLQSDLSTVNAYFDKILMEMYPKLTKSEREISSFIRLNFSIKEIAQIRNASINSIKMARSRIRKKMSLSPDNKLDQFIKSI